MEPNPVVDGFASVASDLTSAFQAKAFSEKKAVYYVVLERALGQLSRRKVQKKI